MINWSIFAALLSAVSFGLFIAIVPLLYAEGVGAFVVMLLRMFFVVLLFGFFYIFSGVRLVIPESWFDRFLIMGFGLGVGGMGLSYLQAVSYIPVSLAVMIFFTWPLVAVLQARLWGRSFPGPLQSLLLLLAFLSLLLAVGPGISGANLAGVGWALMASLCISSSLHFSHYVYKRTSGFTLVFCGSLFGFIFFSVGLLLGDIFGGISIEYRFSIYGILLLLFLSILYVVGLGCQVYATGRSSPEFVSIFYNVEPIVTLFGAYILLGESLSMFQYFASFSVILSLFLYCYFIFRGSLKR